MAASFYQVDPVVFSEKFLKQENFAEILEHAKTCRLSVLNNRLTCWRLFLNIFSESEPCSKWVEDLQTFRQSYQDLKLKHLAQDFDLKSKILNSENVQKLRLNLESCFEVLKVWLEVNNSEVTDEMIEVLCIVFTVVDTEKFEKSDPGESEDFLRELNSPRFVTCDTYQLFDSIMTRYLLTLHTHSNLPSPTSKKRTERALLEVKSDRIYHFYLKSLDPELYNYLKSNQIETEKYLKNWILCLFTMEFNQSSVLQIWDFLLSIDKYEPPKLPNCRVQESELVSSDFICLSMLMNIRDLIMEENVHRINMHLSAFTLVSDLENLLKTAYKSMQFFQKNQFLKYEPGKDEKKTLVKKNKEGFLGKVKGGLKKISIGGFLNKFVQKKPDRFSNVKLDLINIGKDECEVEQALRIIDRAIQELTEVKNENFELERLEFVIEELKKIRLE